jgi:hypothetical protein
MLIMATVLMGIAPACVAIVWMLAIGALASCAVGDLMDSFRAAFRVGARSWPPGAVVARARDPREGEHNL